MSDNYEMPDLPTATIEIKPMELESFGQKTESKILENPLPNATESEQLVLGSVLLDNEMFPVIYSANIRAKHFYSPFNRMVFEAMLELFKKSEVIDPITISSQMTTNGYRPESYGGIIRITDLTYGLPHFSEKSVLQHVSSIIKKHIARNLTKTGNMLISDSLSETEDVAAILTKTLEQLNGFKNELNGRDKESKRFYEMYEITPKLAEQFVMFRDQVTNGVSTGMKELDEKLEGGGLQPKAMYLVAGQEKSGKTSLALDWAFDCAEFQRKRSLIVTGEMSKESLAKRIYSFYRQIPFHHFRPGLHDSKEMQSFTLAMTGLEDFGKIPISIADDLFTITDIEEAFKHKVDAIREANIKNPDDNLPFGMGVVDYLQLIELDKPKSRRETVEEVSRRVKLLANSLDIPIVIMSSMNRLGLTDNKGKDEETIPDTYNLRESQSIAFDAEAVMFVYNPLYRPGKKFIPQPIMDMELIISRQRNGPTGVIPMKFIGKYMQFMTLEHYSKAFGSMSPEQAQEVKTLTQVEIKELDELWNDNWS